MQEYAAQNSIAFNFIPCYSPAWGGLWEAAVKSVKYHLKRVLGSVVLTYEQINTVLVEIVGIFNSRPLIPLSSDINNYDYLTPGHFLIGCSPIMYPEINYTETPQNRLNFWNSCTKIKQSFWKIWSKQYINVLQNRPKWRNETPNIKVGSLVVLRLTIVLHCIGRWLG